MEKVVKFKLSSLKLYLGELIFANLDNVKPFTNKLCDNKFYSQIKSVILLDQSDQFSMTKWKRINCYT